MISLRWDYDLMTCTGILMISFLLKTSTNLIGHCYWPNLCCRNVLTQNEQRGVLFLLYPESVFECNGGDLKMVPKSCYYNGSPFDLSEIILCSSGPSASCLGRYIFGSSENYLVMNHICINHIHTLVLVTGL